MANYTGTSNDWAAQRASYKQSLEEARPFEEYFLGTSYGRKAAEATAEYAETTQAESQQAQYDITSAFKNYKQSQMNILQNRNLATGFKKQVSEDLASSFAGTRGAIESNLASSLRKQYKNYLSTMEGYQQKAQSEYEKEIAANVDYLTNIQEAWYTKAGLNQSMLEVSRDTEGGLGFYEPVEEEPGTFRMTDVARRSAYETVYGTGAVGEEDFGNYLRQQYGDETADWFYANRGLANEMVFGLDPEVTGTAEERTKYYTDYSVKEIEESNKGLFDYLKQDVATFAKRDINQTNILSVYQDVEKAYNEFYNKYKKRKDDRKFLSWKIPTPDWIDDYDDLVKDIQSKYTNLDEATAKALSKYILKDLGMLNITEIKSK